MRAGRALDAESADPPLDQATRTPSDLLLIVASRPAATTSPSTSISPTSCPSARHPPPALVPPSPADVALRVVRSTACLGILAHTILRCAHRSHYFTRAYGVTSSA